MVGIADSGVDVGRLGGTRDRLAAEELHAGSVVTVTDELGHGTGSRACSSRNRPGRRRHRRRARRRARDRAHRRGRTRATAATIAQNLIAAFGWFRSTATQIVNVSANVPPNPRAGREPARAAAVGRARRRRDGNGGRSRAGDVPGVAAGRARRRRARRQLRRRSGRIGARPAGRPRRARRAGSGVDRARRSSAPDRAVRRRRPTAPRSRAPLVTGAAALVWATHPAWDASRVAAALTLSAKHLSGARPNAARATGCSTSRPRCAASPPGRPRRAERLGLRRAQGPCARCRTGPRSPRASAATTIRSTPIRSTTMGSRLSASPARRR